MTHLRDLGACIGHERDIMLKAQIIKHLICTCKSESRQCKSFRGRYHIIVKDHSDNRLGHRPGARLDTAGSIGRELKQEMWMPR